MVEDGVTTFHRGTNPPMNKRKCLLGGRRRNRDEGRQCNGEKPRQNGKEQITKWLKME